MLSLTTFLHTAGNIKNLELDYRRWLLPGEVITSQNIASSSTTLTVVNAAIELGRRLTFQLVGGVAGENPTITMSITTSKSEIKIDTLQVLVTSP